MDDSVLNKKLRVSSSIGLAGTLLFLVLRIADGSAFLPYSLALCFVLFAIARLLTHLKLWPRLTSHCVCIAAFFALASSQIEDGGRDSISLWLISVVPLAAGDLLGPRGIPAYFLLSALSILAPWLVEFFGGSYPSSLELASIDYIGLRFVGIIGVSTACMHAAKAYDTQLAELSHQRLEIYETHQKAQELNREKTSFLRQMSREIRAPLNGIKGMTQVWAQEDMDTEGQEAVLTMDRCADNLISILNDAQDLSQAGQHQFQISYAPFSIDRLVQDIERLFQAKAREKNIELLSSGSTGPKHGIGDEKRLTQILSNLVGNAIKFSDHGKVELRWEWLERAPPQLRFEVRDQGIGMTKEQLENLFQEFNQVHQEESVRRGGTGLGLTISKKLVEAMGGTLIAESQAGTGSCFRLDLPMQSTTASATELDAKPDTRQELSGLQILVVDDDESSLWVQGLALESMGCEVHCARSAQDAIALARARSFDLAVLDLRMPDIDGLGTLSALVEESEQKLPAIVLTASADPEDQQRCLQAGFAQVLLKPFDYQKLRDAVHQHAKRAPKLKAVV